MSKLVRLWISVMVVLGSVTIAPIAAAAPKAATPIAIETTASLPTSSLAPSDVVTVTILHTNDFHGNLQLAGSNPGSARVAKVINDVRAAVGEENVALFDAGDIMQGSLLSNLFKGESAIDVYNLMGYDLATFGNHEFDWGQQVLVSRTTQANFPFVAANLTLKQGGSCAGWETPAWARPWVTVTLGSGANQVVIGVVGVTSQETPYITVASATEGLCFKDPADSILHYYDAVDAASDVIVVLSHIGNTDGGYGYGLTVYGDQTLAKKLAAAGKPVALIIGGHSHTDLTAAQVVNGITVVQAHYSGRKVGRADIGVDKSTGKVTVAWQRLVVSTTGDEDPTVKARVEQWASDPWYLEQINRVVGYTNVDLVRNYNGDSLMGKFINDAIYNDLNTDTEPLNDADMVFNNPGGLRVDILTGGVTPFTLTHGSLYSVLPFGNQTIVGDMTGAQILDLLNQSATLFKGALQTSGVRYSFYRYADALPGPQPYAWGAFDITVKDRDTGEWEPLVMTQTYRVATNEFLAPAGQDGFTPFKYMTNISYWGDMLDGVERWVSAHYTITTPYNETLDGRIARNGDDSGGTIFPVTILHHNDSHGNLAKGQYVGYTQLATLIKQERAHNPYRTILLNGGDAIQGDAMMYYFKSAPLGYAADGTPLPPALQTHPMMAVLNVMNYAAMVVGNHEYNFGNTIFKAVLGQANFPMLQANVYDSGAYGLADVPIEPSVAITVENVHQGSAGTILLGDPIKIAILGIGNHRVPNYELPSNIPGLTFTNPITEAQARVPALRTENDVVVALTHIGFTENPASVEVDTNVDTNLAAQTNGIDAIIGSHSHTDPSKQTLYSGNYKYLPAIVGSPDNTPVIINQAYRYNNTLGEVIIGLRFKDGKYEVVARAGRYISVASDTPEDPEIKAIVDPYVAALNAYNSTILGKTVYPIDATTAYTQETNGANLQTDASVWELQQHGINVDFHLSGAMSNRKVADTATLSNPFTLTVGNMFTLMPYENSLVTMRMNGPQLKTILERAYRNYYYYKYVPGYGGYSYYTTCMLDINKGGKITYYDTYPALPDGNNVASLTIGDRTVDFLDATTYYTVSTVNYLAAGSCNFNNGGVSLWPLDQIVNDTQYYVRDAVINYVRDQQVISPTVEGRLVFLKLYRIYLPLVLRNSGQ
ncbi:MAG TPA: 5'-nucleotidase C-terminal domain-containing protein [Anaerolineae bacterium]|nr:5'-nucleotidase C-terminal domain-containing protein [Anaerolineae bacterium]HQK15473.1 5'-nucleotidase C-terminal domain-containing protein [Anaerolineae bacterium]